MGDLKDHTKINRKKVVLAGWSAGAGMVLPFISNPGGTHLPEGISVVGAILTYPYTYGCYGEIEFFNVPVLIHFGKLDGNKADPLSGYYCWKDKIVKFCTFFLLLKFTKIKINSRGKIIAKTIFVPIPKAKQITE